MLSLNHPLYASLSTIITIPLRHPLDEALENAKRFKLSEASDWQQLSHGEKSIEQMLALFFDTPLPLLPTDFLIYHPNPIPLKQANHRITELSDQLFSFAFQIDQEAYLSQAYDQHPTCLYPSSYLWLKSKLPYDFQRLTLPYCPALDQYHSQYQPLALSILLVQSEFSNQLYFRIKTKSQSYLIDYQAKPVKESKQKVIDLISQKIPYAYEILEEIPTLASIQKNHTSIKLLEYPVISKRQEIKLILLYLWESQRLNFHENHLVNAKARGLLRLIDLIKGSRFHLLRPYAIIDHLDLLRQLDRHALLGLENQIDIDLLISQVAGAPQLSPKQSYLNQGHYSKSLGFELSYTQKQGLLQGLTLSLHCHQWADPQHGYSIYTAKSFFTLGFKYSKAEELKLDRFTLVDYFHLKEITTLRNVGWKAISWRVNGSYGEGLACSLCMTAQAGISVGIFSALFQQSLGIWFAPDIQLERDYSSSQNHSLFGASLFFKWNATVKLLLTLQNRIYYDPKLDQNHYQILSQNRYHIRSWLALQLSVLLSNHDQKAWIGINTYF